MKQFPKTLKPVDSSAFVELQMQKILQKHSTDKDQQSVCMLMDHQESRQDLWLIYELCAGRTLNELLFQVKGEFFKGERIYMVHHGAFYHHIRQSTELLRSFLAKMSSALALFDRLGIVHADLKPDNIIVDYDCEE
jgi:serine/threonine protein kinase